MTAADPERRHLEILVEERSAMVALELLLPRILSPEDTFEIRVFPGKPALLRKLPARLLAYRNWIPRHYRIVVLIDRDQDDCKSLKLRLDRIATEAGFVCGSELVNRIAIEELEAWYLGDVAALRMAFPKVPSTLASRKKYRDPDAIAGGTWETLERLLQRYGYFSGGLRKIELAEKVAPHMNPDDNRSASSRTFLRSLEQMRDV